IDAIDLSRFAAGPKVALAVEGEAFRVVEPGGENRNLFDRNLRHWFHGSPTPSGVDVPGVHDRMVQVIQQAFYYSNSEKRTFSGRFWPPCIVYRSAICHPCRIPA